MSKRITIKGFVQGVLFRQNVKKLAEGLGIKGYAKNLQNGDVEIVAHGKNLSQLIEWCKKGPKGARVEEVVVEEAFQEFDDFRIEY